MRTVIKQRQRVTIFGRCSVLCLLPHCASLRMFHQISLQSLKSIIPHPCWKWSVRWTGIPSRGRAGEERHSKSCHVTGTWAVLLQSFLFHCANSNINDRCLTSFFQGIWGSSHVGQSRPWTQTRLLGPAHGARATAPSVTWIPREPRGNWNARQKQ